MQFWDKWHVSDRAIVILALALQAKDDLARGVLEVGFFAGMITA